MTISMTRPEQGPTERPTTWVENWASQAACRNVEPDDLFVRGAAQQTAKLICQGCPVIAECLADALDNNMEFGVWGGMTERERRALLKRRPDVTSWKALFQQDRANRDRTAS